MPQSNAILAKFIKTTRETSLAQVTLPVGTTQLRFAKYTWLKMFKLSSGRFSARVLIPRRYLRHRLYRGLAAKGRDDLPHFASLRPSEWNPTSLSRGRLSEVDVERLQKRLHRRRMQYGLWRASQEVWRRQCWHGLSHVRLRPKFWWFDNAQ